jgi:hypothetical protein
VGAPPEPEEPLQPQLCCSSHVKLLPQSAATAHGNRYLGVHRLSVVSSQTGGSEAQAQSGWSLGQAQPLAEQPPLVHSWQTMPALHSASLVQ